MNNKYSGKDNFGKPKSEFLESLTKLSDQELFEKCEHYIWLSAYANNNPRSDYHWQCDACYDECASRNKHNIYKKAHEQTF